MKKLSIVIIFLIWVFTVPAYAWVHPKVISETSGEVAASGSIYSKACYLTSFYVLTDGTNAATAILYNYQVASGATTKVAEFTVPGASRQDGRPWIFPVPCENGLYLDLSGTGASCIIEYIPY
jgi:hypothetical protein